MICSRCGKETSQIYVTRMRDEDTRLSLCPACHRALALDTHGLLPYSEEESVARGECPVCGMAFEEFRRTGLLGCANCYRAFRRELMPTLRSVQGDTVHHGKKQENIPEEYYDRIRTLVDRIDTLKDSIEKEMRRGAYARAKELNDALQEADADLRDLNRELADGRA